MKEGTLRAEPSRIIVAITGATGAPFGIRILQWLSRLEDVESHLVISRWGRRTIEHESAITAESVEQFADHVHNFSDQAATLSSGSFDTSGMVIAPCSVRTLAAIAHGLADNLVTRAADVVLKEQRKLVLVVREAPLSPIHLENMLTLSKLGVVMFPPVPAFYNHPESIDDVLDHIAFRVLDQFGLRLPQAARWDGSLQRPERSSPS